MEREPDQSEGKDPLVYNAPGIHLDLSQSLFDCPICTCEQDISERLYKAKNPVFKMTCKGCKRKLEVFSCPITGKLTVTEYLKPSKPISSTTIKP